MLKDIKEWNVPDYKEYFVIERKISYYIHLFNKEGNIIKTLKIKKRTLNTDKLIFLKIIQGKLITKENLPINENELIFSKKYLKQEKLRNFYDK